MTNVECVSSVLFSCIYTLLKFQSDIRLHQPASDLDWNTMSSSGVTLYPAECENLINKLVQSFWATEQTYMEMYAVCTQDSTSALGFAEFFHLCALRNGTLGMKLLNYHTSRGGQMIGVEIRRSIGMPEKKDMSAEKLMLMAFDMEKMLLELMNEIHLMARSKNDMSTDQYIDSKLMKPQTQMLTIIQNHIRGLNESENLWTYDVLTMKPFVSKIYQMIGLGEMTPIFRSCSLQGNVCAATNSVVSNWNKESLEAFASSLLC
ncbi:unnamed protein product [Calicophoron daubneyi]|uniref:Ferritin n=1 Tax=Calicophoron daubneyi TaxID=300641 RepID=A0AAV2TXK4_CALDB